MATRRKRKAAAKKASRKSARRPAAKKKAAARKGGARKAASKKPAAKRATTAKRRSPETLRFRNVSPGLTVADIQRSIAWYRDVMAFHVRETWTENGQVRGADVVAGAARFVLSQDDWSKGRDRKKGDGMRLYLTTVHDVDEIAKGIEQRGGRLDTQPADMWGMRVFTLTDPDGFKLAIGSE